jgi:NAD(P)-dependent dehydrogenase (short-subunit alcohol dehydrogenase family)
MDGMKPLDGRVCLVAGATRGAGRGIARALGEAGATVWCTGRSVRGRPATGTRPETIEETAELVTAAGGRGLAARTDHTVEAEVAALLARIRAESGRLDLLVNDVWGGDALVDWSQPFWTADPSSARTLLDRAVFSHLLTARHAVPLMVEAGRGLVVEITDGNGFTYRGNLAYDLVKMAVLRMAFGMAWELRRTGVTAVAVSPGFLRSEEMLERFGVTEATWREGAKVDPNFIASETPLYVGRAVAALAADPRVAELSGRVFGSWDLSDRYGFTDADGTRPHWARHFEAAYGQPVGAADEAAYASWRGGPAAAVLGDWP